MNTCVYKTIPEMRNFVLSIVWIYECCICILDVKFNIRMAETYVYSISQHNLLMLCCSIESSELIPFLLRLIL